MICKVDGLFSNEFLLLGFCYKRNGYPDLHEIMHKCQSWSPAKAQSYDVEIYKQYGEEERHGTIKVTYYTTRKEGKHPVYHAPKGEPQYMWNSAT